jgi:hypothetical protein
MIPGDHDQHNMYAKKKYSSYDIIYTRKSDPQLIKLKNDTRLDV